MNNKMPVRLVYMTKIYVFFILRFEVFSLNFLEGLSIFNKERVTLRKA